MRLPLLLIGIGVASAWLPDRGDPRRAGESDATAPRFCPQKGCGLALFKEDDEYVCDGGHVHSWDDAARELVLVDD